MMDPFGVHLVMYQVSLIDLVALRPPDPSVQKVLLGEPTPIRSVDGTTDFNSTSPGPLRIRGEGSFFLFPSCHLSR